MSAFGPKRTSLAAPHMSAFGGKADMTFCNARIGFKPKADIAPFLSTPKGWYGLYCPGLGEAMRQREFITLIGNGAGPLQQPPNHHLAQLNIGRIRYEIDDPRMADFTNNLALVNGLAERTPGFVWRYIDESGNSTSTRPYADPRIAINLSVWESVEALERFVYQTIH